MKFVSTLILLAVTVVTAAAQVTTGLLEGTVTDTQGGAVTGAEGNVINEQTGQNLKTTTGERGEWVLPSMPTGTYRVTVSHQGFKVAKFDGVKVDIGKPSTVNTMLELGALTETVEVVGGAEV